MKKLMIAAMAAAIVGGVSAKSLCEDEINPETPIAGCGVWDVKVSVKTLAPKKINCKYACDDADVSYYFENGTRKLTGILFACEAVCDLADANLALWETKSKSVIAPITKTVDGTTVMYSGSDNIDFAVLDRYSKKANKVEAVATIENDVAELVLAGFGTFDANNMIVKSISGNCAGTMVPAEFVISQKCKDDEFETGKVAPLCEDFEDWCISGEGTDAVAASGTWSIKYNKSLSKGKKTLAQIVPNYEGMIVEE